MKKIISLMIAVMMLISCCSFAMAEEDTIKIGILAPATTHGWVGGVAYFAKLAAEETGVEYVYVTSSNEAEMSSQIEEMITQEVDGIVVWPQFTGVETAAEMALEAGIVIYNFDMIINVDEKYADNMYVLTGDNYGMGVACANYIAEKLEGTGKVFVLNKPTAGNVNDDRCAGFNDTIAEIAPDIEIIGEAAIEFARENDMAVMADALTAYPEIDAVLSIDDETSIGALQAISEAGRTDIKAITGGGGCQEYFKLMQDEKYANIGVASMTYSPDMIQQCIYNLVAVLNGETIDHLVVLPTNTVDLSNVAEFLNENSPY